MSLVILPGLKEMLEEISVQYHLPEIEVQEALREALLKGYERYRRSQQLEKRIQYSEDYFDNFDVELDTEEEGFCILSTKTIVEEIENTDHHISLEEVQSLLKTKEQDNTEEAFLPEVQIGEAVVLDVTPDQKEFGRMAAIQTKQVLLQKLRDRQRKMIQDEFKDLEGSVLNARILRFERQSAIVAVTSGFGKPEVEAELPKREQLPNDNYRANATFKILLKKVKDGIHRGPQLLASRAAAGLVVDLFATEVPEIEDEVVRIVAMAREANPP
ncbi:NusA N-terminal domain-containing protein, partial [Spirulina sp. 06S082]|uniref:NusA N-terminal domain-containing protein n=1 Tax=Spirulina sp. 06S082 TaxID=3110248 RepID=UPI002B1E9140